MLLWPFFLLNNSCCMLPSTWVKAPRGNVFLVLHGIIVAPKVLAVGYGWVWVKHHPGQSIVEYSTLLWVVASMCSLVAAQGWWHRMVHDANAEEGAKRRDEGLEGIGFSSTGCFKLRESDFSAVLWLVCLSRKIYSKKNTVTIRNWSWKQTSTNIIKHLVCERKTLAEPIFLAALWMTLWMILVFRRGEPPTWPARLRKLGEPSAVGCWEVFYPRLSQIILSQKIIIFWWYYPKIYYSADNRLSQIIPEYHLASQIIAHQRQLEDQGVTIFFVLIHWISREQVSWEKRCPFRLQHLVSWIPYPRRTRWQKKAESSRSRQLGKNWASMTYQSLCESPVINFHQLSIECFNSNPNLRSSPESLWNQWFPSVIEDAIDFCCFESSSRSLVSINFTIYAPYIIHIWTIYTPYINYISTISFPATSWNLDADRVAVALLSTF